ncbi:transmembrane protein 51a [Lampris incognitus]|uniref:transmembrane protein 51a n=1 Tax=Lampris incognitus TaxID=2546036 RepID=UPI0024B48BCA|nr:transmembrane protein 51a [Lampris incognitus]XP_056130467.1 transmembrane protein 51a [Lampris incognitus]
MPSAEDLPPSSSSRGNNDNNVNNNNNNYYHNSNSSSSGSGNSGSQYALCALGVGLVALGIVMIVWSVVPADMTGNNGSGSGGGGGGTTGSGGRPDNRNKVSSVAFVLVGSGVVMLLLSLCLGMRNKQREQQRHQEAQNQEVGGVTNVEQEESETAEERAQRYAVPTYEEAVGSGQYPVRLSNLHHSSSQLPSYEDLIQVDGIRYEFEGPEVTQAVSQPVPASVSAANATSASSASNRRGGKTVRKLLPLKIRRIKSEKLPMKSADNSQSTAGISLEPLTPPPQYDDKVPPL